MHIFCYFCKIYGIIFQKEGIMETVMQIFAIIGIIVSILAVLLFVVWAVSFYSSVAIKTFKYNLGEYCKVKKEHIEKNSQARRLRLAKSREQKNKQKEEMQNIKLQTKRDLYEIKRRESIAKQSAKVEKAKSEAKMRSDIDVEDIGKHNYENTRVIAKEESEPPKSAKEIYDELPTIMEAPENIIQNEELDIVQNMDEKFEGVIEEEKIEKKKK